eukprot:SAG25_NODE_8967_length_394_cov_1.044068_1_plen_64_part_10
MSSGQESIVRCRKDMGCVMSRMCVAWLDHEASCLLLTIGFRASRRSVASVDGRRPGFRAAASAT